MQLGVLREKVHCDFTREQPCSAVRQAPAMWLHLGPVCCRLTVASTIRLWEGSWWRAGRTGLAVVVLAEAPDSSLMSAVLGFSCRGTAV